MVGGRRVPGRAAPLRNPRAGVRGEVVSGERFPSVQLSSLFGELLQDQGRFPQSWPSPSGSATRRGRRRSRDVGDVSGSADEVGDASGDFPTGGDSGFAPPAQQKQPQGGRVVGGGEDLGQSKVPGPES